MSFNPFSSPQSDSDRSQRASILVFVPTIAWIFVATILGAVIGLAIGMVYGDAIAGEYVPGFNQQANPVKQYGESGLVMGGFWGFVSANALWIARRVYLAIRNWRIRQLP